MGPLVNELQRQVNLVEALSLQKGRHALKVGVDYRRLSPNVGLIPYNLSAAFLSVPQAVSLHPFTVGVSDARPTTILFHNLGAYAQDTWNAASRLSLTYGVRWDVDVAPSTAHGPDFLGLSNVSDPNTLAVAPSGSPVFRTRYNNFAPRVGVTYVLLPAPKHETLLRGGIGIFYDLATTQTADMVETTPVFPFGATVNCPPVCNGGSLTFPLPAAIVQPPPIALAPTQTLTGFDPNLKLPYSLQWNVSLEQSLGDKQAITASYLGAVGRRLIQKQVEFSPFPRTVGIFGNSGTSDYHALQLQFQRQMSRGLQVLGFYAWSHSIDDGSSSSGQLQNFSSAFGRASSAFDIRHSFSTGFSYQIPSPAVNAFFKSIAQGWAVDSMIQGRSATPVDVTVASLVGLGSSFFAVRPDVVPGQPLNLFGPQFPGGKMFNPNAFVNPPTDPVTHLALREGNLGRNTLRGFGAFQWDLAASRTISLREGLHLQFRAELFNVLNHPNFANPNGSFGTSLFGRSTQTLNQGLSNSNIGSGGFSPLYQIGGPRSGQLVVRLSF